MTKTFGEKERELDRQKEIKRDKEDRSEQHEFGSQFLCVVCKQCLTENAETGKTIQIFI